MPSKNFTFTTRVDPVSPPPHNLPSPVMWWRRRVPPPGPQRLFHKAFIAIAGEPAGALYHKNSLQFNELGKCIRCSSNFKKTNKITSFPRKRESIARDSEHETPALLSIETSLFLSPQTRLKMAQFVRIVLTQPRLLPAQQARLRGNDVVFLRANKVKQIYSA